MKYFNFHYNFLTIDCIKKYAERFLLMEENGSFSKCSVPWTNSMVSESTDKVMLKPPCGVGDGINQSMVLLDFFYKALGYEIPSCKGKEITMDFHLTLFNTLGRNLDCQRPYFF